MLFTESEKDWDMSPASRVGETSWFREDGPESISLRSAAVHDNHGGRFRVQLDGQPGRPRIEKPNQHHE